ncbi:MAG: hypothetical protein Q9172_003986 [Xanthocarpia lactea]
MASNQLHTTAPIINAIDNIVPRRRSSNSVTSQAPQTYSHFVTREEAEEIWGLKQALDFWRHFIQHPEFCYPRREGDFAGNTKRVVLANKYGNWPQGPKLWADLKLHSYNVHWVYWTIDWAGQRYVVHEQGKNTALGAHWRRWMGPAQGYQDMVLAFTWDPTDRRDPANNFDTPFLPQVDEYPHVAPYYEGYFDTDSDDENEEHADIADAVADPDARVPRDLDDQVLPEETFDDDATISETSDSFVEAPATLATAIKRSKAKTVQDSEDELEDDTEEEIEERPSKRTKTSVETPTSATTSICPYTIPYTIPRVRKWKKRPRRNPEFKIFDEGEYEAAQVSSSV